MPLINAKYADVFSETRGLKFVLCPHLHSCFVYASSEGSGESLHMRRLTRALLIDNVVLGACTDYSHPVTPLCKQGSDNNINTLNPQYNLH